MEKENQTQRGGGGMPTVRGDRICRHCGGLCHGECLRTNAGPRRKYFCREGCYKFYLKELFGGIPDDAIVQHAIKRYMERVVVQ